MDSSDNFITNFGGQSLTASFIDSGSNGLFFPDYDRWLLVLTTLAGIARRPRAFTATNVDPNNGSTTNTVTFNVDDFDTVTASQSQCCRIQQPRGTDALHGFAVQFRLGASVLLRQVGIHRHRWNHCRYHARSLLGVLVLALLFDFAAVNFDHRSSPR